MADPVDTAELRRLLARASEGPWFATDAATDDGLTRVDDGRSHGLFPFDLEAHDAALVVGAVNALPAVLDSLDLLRREKAESEAACAVLVEAARKITGGDPSKIGSHPIGPACGVGVRDQWTIDKGILEPALADLPASVRRHLAEVEALREVADAAWPVADLIENGGPCYEVQALFDALFDALNALDAVRKGGG